MTRGKLWKIVSVLGLTSVNTVLSACVGTVPNRPQPTPPPQATVQPQKAAVVRTTPRVTPIVPASRSPKVTGPQPDLSAIYCKPPKMAKSIGGKATCAY